MRRPIDGESLREFIDRTICNLPNDAVCGKLKWSELVGAQPYQFFEVSWVTSPPYYGADYAKSESIVIEIPSIGI